MPVTESSWVSKVGWRYAADEIWKGGIQSMADADLAACRPGTPISCSGISSPSASGKKTEHADQSSFGTYGCGTHEARQFVTSGAGFNVEKS
jgi:hypothetical protein